MDQALPPRPLFRSFWSGGFEGSTHINGQRQRVDLVAATGHDRQADADYGLLRSVGIRTARDCLRWPLMDRGGGVDFSPWVGMVAAARRHDVQVIWDLCHFGWPDDLDVFSSAFVDRFARFCGAAARYLADHGETAPLFCPINEISFLSWAAGEIGWFHPHAQGRGLELKRQLVRAAIAGIDAIREQTPGARIVHVDPVIRVVAPLGRPDLEEDAARQHGYQFQAWDMLCGRLAPELGGHPGYLDIVGINFYHNNQREVGGPSLEWAAEPRDPRWRRFHALLGDLHRRYGRPLFVAETGHFGVGRARWLDEIVDEVLQARAQGVPVEGVCLYPVIDRPDWEAPGYWHRCGLWDLVPDSNGEWQRVPVPDYLAALRRAQERTATPKRAASGF